ncbi:hypothetical protein V6x_28310 [Gimesia chilikensis]|uniref:Uncharacterized protein n=1 Tax=Gimesia chilikensis TaxID=2605989 RepID=A0A517WCY4_9PLAN|nr:hypothetical protein [Gimesia chilikensis]QDU03119.1 hypothetical protein V6x_28310 [Gimesia chilikensis]
MPFPFFYIDGKEVQGVTEYISFFQPRKDRYFIGSAEGYYKGLLVGSGWTDSEIDAFVANEMVRLNQVIQQQNFYAGPLGKVWKPDPPDKQEHQDNSE